MTAKYAEYLFTLDDPRDAVMSFNRDIVTLSMLSDFVFEVLSESKSALLDENRCKCPSTKGITAVYHRLARVLEHLLENKQSVDDCFVTVCGDGDHCRSGELRSWSGTTGPEGGRRSFQCPFYFDRVHFCCFPSLSPFRLDVIQVDNGDLPFLVHEFVREERYRMVSLTDGVIVLLVLFGLLTVCCPTHAIVLHWLCQNLGQDFIRGRPPR